MDILRNKRVYFILILVVFVLLATLTIVLPIKNNVEPQSTFQTHESSVVLGASSEQMEKTEPQTIFVQISGAVNNPQILEIENGTRLFEIIDKLGGFDDKVSAEFVNKHLNLAEKLTDGQLIYIPFEGEEWGEPEPIKTEPKDVSTKDNLPININTANMEELITLPNIGPSTAAKIIEYREQEGEFESISDIQNVAGIGEKTFDAIKSLITVD